MPKAPPANPALYEQVKSEAKAKFDNWPSAYGSQWLTKTYKARGGTYTGKKPSKNEGPQRWNREEWVDEYGNPCGSSKNRGTKKCRPKKKINEDTPVTWGEMTESEKKKAIKEKKKVGMGKKAKAISPKKKKVTIVSPKKKRATVKSPRKKRTVKSPKKSKVKSPTGRRKSRLSSPRKAKKN